MKEKSPKLNGTNSRELKESLKLFDAVIVLGNVSRFDGKRNQLELSFDGKMRTIAAGELYRSGLTSRIILSGGHTSGKEQPSEAVLMADYLIKHFQIPPEFIILEEESTDSVENIVNVKKLLKKSGINGRLAILTNAYHIERIKKIMENEGLSAEPVTAEEKLPERSSHYQPMVGEYLSSGLMKMKKMKEAIMRGLLIVDPAGELPRKITKRLRS